MAVSGLLRYHLFLISDLVYVVRPPRRFASPASVWRDSAHPRREAYQYCRKTAAPLPLENKYLEAILFNQYTRRDTRRFGGGYYTPAVSFPKLNPPTLARSWKNVFRAIPQRTHSFVSGVVLQVQAED